MLRTKFKFYAASGQAESGQRQQYTTDLPGASRATVHGFVFDFFVGRFLTPISSCQERPEQPASAIHLQRGNEGFLRDVDLAELPHLLLAFLLLLQKFSFARDVAAIALCGDVLAQGA